VQRDGQYVVNLRPVASPLPLAFGGLLIASIIVSAYELRWIPPAQHHSTGWVLLAVPIPLQLLAAWWGFESRSSAAATGSAVLAAVWLGLALDFITTAPGPPGPSNAVGMLMFGAAAVLLAPLLAELRVGSLLPAAVLATTAVRFALTGVSGVAHRTAWAHASGWCGLAVAVVSLYAVIALELEGAMQEALLPTFRRRRSRTAMDGPLEEQVARLENETGVRATV
jgi:succinate-acetate transporter protein